MRNYLLVGTLAIFASLAGAAENLCREELPGASDKNPGTQEKPLATIQAGVEKRQTGDTIYVKAGDYEETVCIDKPGNPYRPTVLAAWKDDQVRIGYRPRPLPGRPASGSPSPAAKAGRCSSPRMCPMTSSVLVNQDSIVTYMQDTPVKDDMTNHAAYRKSDHNADVQRQRERPLLLGTFEYGRRPSSLTFFRVDPPAAGWVIRKFEFSFEGMGIYLSGDNCTVEDCFFTRCYRGGIALHGRTGTVRRCCFYRCGGAVGGSGPGIAHLLEDNIIVECGLRAENDILVVDIPSAAVEGGGAHGFKGTMMGQNFLYNIVSDNDGAGWYADCSDSQSSRIVGNAFWDNLGGGIYNEACVADTIAQGNLFYRNGASSSVWPAGASSTTCSSRAEWSGTTWTSTQPATRTTCFEETPSSIPSTATCPISPPAGRPPFPNASTDAWWTTTASGPERMPC